MQTLRTINTTKKPVIHIDPFEDAMSCHNKKKPSFEEATMAKVTRETLDALADN